MSIASGAVEQALSSPAREASVRAKTRGSLERYQRAMRSLAGGVSSGLRRSAHPYPLYLDSGEGARVRDVDGNSYIDYGLAWGPLILGHSPPEVVEAVQAQLSKGFTFGAQHELEYEVAGRLTGAIPCADLVAFANSGTEIVQVALRLARAASGRDRFLKFEGHYHGWDDSVLVSYHPTPAEIERYGTQAVPVGRGQRPGNEAVVCEWNDRGQVERAFAAHGGRIAAILCEPILCNSFCIPPAPGFLEFLRETAWRQGALLIFDEVITGFRVALGGAQELYGVTPDLATYAKAVGAGTALSVLAGRKRYMEMIAAGTVVHAGTLNGNPLSLAAARAALDRLSRNGGEVYGRMRSLAARLRAGIERAFQSRGCAVAIAGEGPVFHVSFLDAPPRNYRDTWKADQAMYVRFAVALLDEGVLVLQDGRWYVSAAHTGADVDETIAAVNRVLG